MKIAKNRKLNILVKNIDPNNSYTYRFFGNSTQLPPVDNNNPIFLPSTVNKINVGTNPLIGIAVPTNGFVYFLNFGDNSVSVIDTNNNVVQTIMVGNNPQNGCFCPITSTLFICNSTDGTVSVIDVNTLSPTYNQVISTITVQNSPQGALFVADNNLVYILNNQSATISAINPLTNLVVATTSFLGGNMVDMIYVSFNRSLYVTSIFGAWLAVVSIDTNDIYTTVMVGANPRGNAWDTVHNRIYTTNEGQDSISVTDVVSNTSLGVVPTSGMGGFSDIYFSPNGNVYVAGLTANVVYVIDTTQGIGIVTDSIPVGSLPFSITYNPSNGFLYVSDAGDDNLFIINPADNSIVQEIAIGNGSRTAVFNPANNVMYIGIFNDNQVAYLTDNSFIPVSIIVNGGLNTILELDRVVSDEPIDIDCIQIDASNIQCLTTALQEKDLTDTGFTHSIPINILKERTSFNNPFSFIVKFCKEKFYSSAFNGERYIQHVIPPSSEIMFYMDYSKIDISGEMGIPSNFMFSDNESSSTEDYTTVNDPFTIDGLFGKTNTVSTEKKKKKRYITAKSF